MQDIKNAFYDANAVNEYKEKRIREMLESAVPKLMSKGQLKSYGYVNISREGANIGIHLVLTMNSINVLHHKLSVNIKMALCFQLANKGDYVATVGQTYGLEPKSTGGRGLLKMTPPLEFQAAFATSGDNEVERLTKLKQVITRISDNWKGDEAKQIPELKGSLELDEILSKREIYKKLKKEHTLTFVGLDEEDYEPIMIDFKRFCSLLVINGTDSSKLNYLNGLLLALVYQHSEKEIEINLIDSSNSSLFQISKIKHANFYSNNSNEIDAFFERMRIELDKRKEAFVNERLSNEGMFNEDQFISRFTKIFIAVDDLGEFNQSINLSTKNTLDRIVRKDRNLGVYLILNSTANDIYNCYESYAKGIKDAKQGIITGDPFAQLLFNVKKTYGKDMKYTIDDGHIFLGGNYKRIKLAFTSPLTMKKYIDQLKSEERSV